MLVPLERNKNMLLLGNAVKNELLLLSFINFF